MRNLVGHAFMYGKHHLTVAPATKHVGMPQCNRCWRYGHLSNARVCPLKGKLCPICGEPHSVEYHCHLASCCRGKPKQTPPIPATPEGDPCPHDAKCINCADKHCADDRVCSFWKSRFKSDLIWHRYTEQKVSESFTNFFLPSSQAASAQSDPRRIPSKST